MKIIFDKYLSDPGLLGSHCSLVSWLAVVDDPFTINTCCSFEDWALDISVGKVVIEELNI